MLSHPGEGDKDGELPCGWGSLWGGLKWTCVFGAVKNGLG